MTVDDVEAVVPSPGRRIELKRVSRGSGSVRPNRKGTPMWIHFGDEWEHETKSLPSQTGQDADPEADEDSHQHEEKGLLALAGERQDVEQGMIKSVDVFHRPSPGG
jgi:hypothetical protein